MFKKTKILKPNPICYYQYLFNYTELQYICTNIPTDYTHKIKLPVAEFVLKRLCCVKLYHNSIVKTVNCLLDALRIKNNLNGVLLLCLIT